MNRWFRGWRIVLVGLAFTVLAGCVPWPRVSGTILLPGLAIAMYWLHINLWEHLVTFSCVVIALNTVIYSALFAMPLGLWRLIRGRANRAKENAHG